MGRLMDRLKVECRNCGYKHVPKRLSARYHNDKKTIVHLWQCVECDHFWQDSVFKKKDN